MIRLSVTALFVAVSGIAHAQTAPQQPDLRQFVQSLTPEQRARFDADLAACRNDVAGKAGDRRNLMRGCMMQRNPQVKERVAAAQRNQTPGNRGQSGQGQGIR
jgi:hypothetical protein